ncbi:PAS domain S-box protein [Sphingomonas sp. PAMC 26621]|uniref:PAS domain S-box protein n=1 Tax=Sphingomonas sp. PAMC 26621 TaxID=1112213 RepID=UPI003FCF3DD2
MAVLDGRIHQALRQSYDGQGQTIGPVCWPIMSSAGPNFIGTCRHPLRLSIFGMTPAQPGRDDARLLGEELALLIDGATNYAIYMLDPRGHVTIWNRGAERIKGWTQLEVLGQNAALFYIPKMCWPASRTPISRAPALRAAWRRTAGGCGRMGRSFLPA